MLHGAATTKLVLAPHMILQLLTKFSESTRLQLVSAMYDRLDLLHDQRPGSGFSLENLTASLSRGCRTPRVIGAENDQTSHMMLPRVISAWEALLVRVADILAGLSSPCSDCSFAVPVACMSRKGHQAYWPCQLSFATW